MEIIHAFILFKIKLNKLKISWKKIINITMLNKNIQKEVDVYLKQRIKIEPKNLKMFFDKSGYAYEKIELKG